MFRNFSKSFIWAPDAVIKRVVSGLRAMGCRPLVTEYDSEKLFLYFFTQFRYFALLLLLIWMFLRRFLHSCNKSDNNSSRLTLSIHVFSKYWHWSVACAWTQLAVVVHISRRRVLEQLTVLLLLAFVVFRTKYVIVL